MSESQKPLHVYYHNQYILVFDFQNLGTRAARQWGDYCLKYNGQYANPLRVLYDFRGCGFPSLYFMAYEKLITPQVTFPSNVRIAYLIAGDDALQQQWSEEFVTSLPDHVETHIFTDPYKDVAIAWLMETLETDTTQDTQSNQKE